jgi:hypothetical protein
LEKKRRTWKGKKEVRSGVFGIIERRGKVKGEVVKDAIAYTLLSLAVKRVRKR